MQRLRSLATARRSPVYEGVFVLGAFLAAFLSRYALDGILPPGFPYLTFFPAVILTGFFAGIRAGLIVAILCGLAAWFFFLDPSGSWRLTGPTVLALAFYVLIVSTDLVLIHLMRLALVKLDDERQTSDRLAQQNKTMFHELQHRISNNLQVIASLLKMQQRNLSDDGARQALETASARLKVIASIQRQLHNPKRQSVDIGQLLKAVLPEVIATANVGERVRLEFDVAPLPVTGDQATPVALIAVELVSNAMEHAATGDRLTEIRVTTGTEGAMGEVRIADDGKGLPPDFQPEKSRSLGLRVAFQFAEQLEGALVFGPGDPASGTGTLARLSFPLASHDSGD